MMPIRPSTSRVALAVAMAILTTATMAATQPDAASTRKPASAQTVQANEKVLHELPFSDRQDFDDASRGFVGTTPNLKIVSDTTGRTVWDLTAYDFLKGDKAPDTINPSLWRIATLNMENGLFKVTDRVYQVRGYDLSNMTIVEGDTGLIITDPLISRETAKAALELYYHYRPHKPVVAVIYTHSHVDHYGGVKGVIDEADASSGKVKVIAPQGFLEEAVSENVFAGTAMGRRGVYMYGSLLPRGPQGQVDGGLGKSTSLGEITLIAPNDTITHTGETRTVDGVTMEFQMAQGTEAPSEMLIWFPQFGMLNTAEDATHTLHNLYTLRGAQVRDASQWWKTLNEAIDRYGDKVKVVIAQHHWPMWDNARVVSYLQDQRDMFKYLHDQTLNLANKGLTPTEIAERLTLPGSVGDKWYNRGYYGSVNHDVKGIYQRYLGWYDSNPAHLYALPPEEAGKRYVDFMGGADKAIAKAREYYARGDYRFVAEVMNHVVFADPSNKAARNLEADALEQLGYQTENPTWRNEFLSGAYELRNGLLRLPGAGVASADTLKAMDADMLLDYAGIRLNGPKAADKTVSLNWVDTDDRATYAIELHHGVLIYSRGKTLPHPDATLRAGKLALAGMLMGGTPLATAIKSGGVTLDGNGAKVDELLGLLDTFDINFNIVTP